MATVDLSTRDGRDEARRLGLSVPPESESWVSPAIEESSPESEKAFQARVVHLAKDRGWRVFHAYDMRRSEPGWPDLTMVRGKRLVFAELKVKGGKLTREQAAWLADLEATGAEVYLWVPSSWSEIERVLS